PVALAVEHDGLAPFGIAVNDLVDQELQGVQGLAFLADDQAAFGACNVERDALVVLASQDLGVAAHPAQDPRDTALSLVPFAPVRGHGCPWRLCSPLMAASLARPAGLSQLARAALSTFSPPARFIHHCWTMVRSVLVKM